MMADYIHKLNPNTVRVRRNRCNKVDSLRWIGTLGCAMGKFLNHIKTGYTKTIVLGANITNYRTKNHVHIADYFFGHLAEVDLSKAKIHSSIVNTSEQCSFHLEPMLLFWAQLLQIQLPIW